MKFMVCRNLRKLKITNTDGRTKSMKIRMPAHIVSNEVHTVSKVLFLFFERKKSDDSSDATSSRLKFYC